MKETEGIGKASLPEGSLQPSWQTKGSYWSPQWAAVIGYQVLNSWVLWSSGSEEGQVAVDLCPRLKGGGRGGDKQEGLFPTCLQGEAASGEEGTKPCFCLKQWGVRKQALPCECLHCATCIPDPVLVGSQETLYRGWTSCVSQRWSKEGSASCPGGTLQSTARGFRSLEDGLLKWCISSSCICRLLNQTYYLVSPFQSCSCLVKAGGEGALSRNSRDLPTVGVLEKQEQKSYQACTWAHSQTFTQMYITHVHTQIQAHRQVLTHKCVNIKQHMHKCKQFLSLSA